MNITEILQALTYLLVAIVSLFVIPAIKNKVGAQNMDEFLRWVDIAVAAAEQLFNSEQAKTKKEYVLNYLSTKGFVVDEAEVEVAIEAAVNRLHHELYGGVMLNERLDS